MARRSPDGSGDGPDDGPGRLSVAAAAILGLLVQNGSQTTYDLKRFIDNSIGYFWPFPHSQLYAETRRLEQLGYIDADEESSGRKRKILSVTDAGRHALAAWKADPVHGSTEIRDIGLLRLFLSDGDDPARIADLASEQRLLHVDKLAEYEELAAFLGDDVTASTYTLRLGIEYEKTAIDFWERVADDLGT